MTSQQFIQLLNDFKAQRLDANGISTLYQAVRSGLYDQLVKEDILHLLEQMENHPLWTADRSNTVWKQLAANTFATSADPFVKSIHGIHLLKTAWFRYAAAIVILLLGSVAYFWNTHTIAPLVVQTNPVPVQNNVAAPAVSRATITLAGGQQIYLDSAMKGTLAIQGNVNIQKMNDGRIVYMGKADGELLQYNTLTVPRGSQIASIVLADGSKVFLNAASSLTYPVAFAANERSVTITGEAYFEVAKDPKKKFIVSGGGISTEVLGTHFNINTYSDEEAMKVSLLEGSVKVSGGDSHLIIKPGDQAAFKNGLMKVNRSVDITQVMAWKDGVFNFNQLPLSDVMKQLSRWYDIDIIYEGTIPHIDFYGEVQRSLSLKDVLEVLSGMGVQFTIKKDRRLIVSKS